MAKVCLLMALPCKALARESAQASAHESAVSAERTGAGNTLLPLYLPRGKADITSDSGANKRRPESK
jgi:hypothetical protein